MSDQRRSRIDERNSTCMTIEGYDSGFPVPRRAAFDFIVVHPDIKPCPFVLISRCYSQAELTEPTARAFANYILKQCDKVKAGRINSNGHKVT